MDFIATGIVAGILGTVVMDVLNHLFYRTGMIVKIENRMIGRMSAGWSRGRFCYRHPDEMEQVANETLYGILTHYAIGVGLALIFVIGWHFFVGGPASSVWALIYGIGTTAASVLVVYPSMGFGIFGLRSPDGIKSPLSSLANHLFYGLGLAAAVAII